MAQQSSDELQPLSQMEKLVNDLQSQMEKLVKDFDAVVDSNELPHRAELDDIFRILGKSKDKQIISQLPEGKKGDLAELLPKIDDMLQQCKARMSSALAKPKQQQQPAKTKKKMPSVSDCNPFKSRSSSPSHDQGKQQGDDDQGAAALLEEKVKAVKQQTIAIFLDADVEYYEWTTSYVDETRIYGWKDEADMVVDALVGPRPPADQADKKGDAPAAEANNKDASKVEKTEAPAEGEELLFRAAGIAGIHGSGKTALAQRVFVHDRIKDAFPLRLWVCVGPPDYEDKFNLLYRMLDNLGLDTAKVEKIVEDSEAVKKSKEAEAAKKSKESEAVKNSKDSEAVKKSKESEAVKNSKESEAVKNSKESEAVKNSEDSEAVKTFKDSEAVNNSRIGVLLFILHVTLYKTGYLIVFDDIRASYRPGGGKDGGKDGDKDSGKDGWYSNLTLQPPKQGEWFERLAYGLPKAKKSAVLVTCRNEDHARIMVRTGSVFRPPKLSVEDGWKLFKREYEEAKKPIGGGSSDFKLEEDKLYKDLEGMQEEIVGKCLGLPVAIIEAAKGFAKLPPLPDPPAEAKPASESKSEKPAEESKSEPAAAQSEAHEDGQSA